MVDLICLIVKIVNNRIWLGVNISDLVVDISVVIILK